MTRFLPALAAAGALALSLVPVRPALAEEPASPSALQMAVAPLRAASLGVAKLAVGSTLVGALAVPRGVVRAALLGERIPGDLRVARALSSADRFLGRGLDYGKGLIRSGRIDLSFGEGSGCHPGRPSAVVQEGARQSRGATR